MIAIAVAAIAALGSVLAAALASRASARSRGIERDHDRLREEHDDVRQELAACVRDRRQLRQTIQLILGSFIRLLPQDERLSLLRSIDEALDDDDDQAA